MALRTDVVRRLTARARGTAANGDASLAEGPERQLRREAMQRLQFGIGGVATMFLLVGLASVIDQRADLAAAATVPEAETTEQPPEAVRDDDPLVSAGVVPALEEEPAATTLAPGSSAVSEDDRLASPQP